MHEIEGEQGGPAESNCGFAEQIFQENIQDGDHQHTAQGAHKAPAEWVQAEQAYAQTDNNFAQRGMGNFVGVYAANVLEGGADVIDLVKVGAVGPVEGFGHRVLFVKQRGGVGIGRKNDPVAIRVKENQFAQFDLSLVAQGGQAKVFARQLLVFGQLGILPVKQTRIGLIQLHAFPIDSVGRVFQNVGTGPKSAVIAYTAQGDGLRCGEGDSFPVLHIQEGLGIGGAAQIPEGGQGINHRQQDQGQSILPFHGVHRGRKGKFPGAVKVLGAIDPFQGALAGNQGVDIITEKAKQAGNQKDRENHRDR